MQIKTINLPKSECFPCGKRDVKNSLDGITIVSVEFRHNILGTPRYSRLSFNGHVLANIGINRRLEIGHFYIFPIPQTQYSEQAQVDFKTNVLPKIRSWIDSELGKGETEISVTNQELFIVWNDNRHTLKLVKFNN